MNSAEPQTPPSFEEAVRRLTALGWKVTSDGPTGVQMQGPKTMNSLHRVLLGVGFVLLFVQLVAGIVLIAAALIGYAALT
jgi:hypothetical protein